jgi:hypothetical protein
MRFASLGYPHALKNLDIRQSPGRSPEQRRTEDESVMLSLVDEARKRLLTRGWRSHGALPENPKDLHDLTRALWTESLGCECGSMGRADHDGYLSDRWRRFDTQRGCGQSEGSANNAQPCLRDTKDGGVDVVAVKDMGNAGLFKTLWQAKKKEVKNKVGLSVVRELADTTREFKASKGIIVTSTYLTRDALARIQRDKYILSKVDRDDLNQWIERVLFKGGE